MTSEIHTARIPKPLSLGPISWLLSIQKLFWIPKLQVITSTYTELGNGNFFLNAHVSKEQQKEQLMKGWDFGILNSSGPDALLLNKRASASYKKIAKKKKKKNRTN